MNLIKWARWRFIWLLTTVVLAANCTDSEPEPDATASGGSNNSGAPDGNTEPDELGPWSGETIFLKALKTYSPIQWQDDTLTLPTAVRFEIPSTIPVTLGNSGNQIAKLRFRTPEDEEVACTYRGGSDVEHPDDGYQKAKGSRYRFEHCSNGLEAGRGASGTWLQLHIDDGDSEDPAALTQVELRLGTSFVELEPPISPEESVKIRSEFSWKETQELPEQNVEGHPALYSMLVYVEEREQIDALDAMLVYYSTLPLFAEEMKRWAGQRGIFTHEGDGHGVFVFTLMPGAVYNLIRFHALEGNDLFAVVAPRDVPAAAKLADGSVSYEVLRASGFLYRDLTPSNVEDWPTTAEPPQQELFNSIKRAILKKIVSVVKSIVQGVVKGLGKVDQWVGGSVDLTIRLDVRNMDPAFGVGTPMQRAWGSKVGQQVNLSGVRVSAWQSTLNGLLPTLFSARTDAYGAAHMKITRGKDTSLCMGVENAAAQVTSLLLPVEVCDFKGISGNQLNSALDQKINVRHRYFNVLAQASEGYEYLHDVVGYTPYKADILVGKLANFATMFNKGAALTPCFGFPNLIYDDLVDALAWSVELVPVVGQAVSVAIKAAGILYAVDMIVADDPSITIPHYDLNFDSRGLISHEYGHFALCSLLYSQGIENITTAYTDAILDRIKNNGSPGPDAEAGYINEGFADFFAAQVAGGVNYFNPNDKVCVQPAGGGVCYCATNSLDSSPGKECMDANERETEDFYGQTARVATLLQDAFDGKPSLPPQDVPGNVDVWRMSSDGLAYSSVNRVGSTDDESVMLAGSDLQMLIAKWSARGDVLSQVSFFGGLSDTMSAAGYDWCSRCKLFALHDARWEAYSMHYEDLCVQEPIASWVGPGSPGKVMVFQPGTEGKDARVWSRPDAVNSNLANHPLLPALAWTWNGVPGVMRSFLEFDVSSIPSQAQVLSAMLTLYANTTSNQQPSGHSQQSGSNEGILWRVAAPWEESTITWNNQPPVDSSSFVLLPASTSNDQTYQIDVTKMVQAMVSQPASNHGFMLQLKTEQYYRALQFWTGDADNPAVRPRLEVFVAGHCP